MLLSLESTSSFSYMDNVLRKATVVEIPLLF